MFWFTQLMLQCLYSIAYKPSKSCEENPGPMILDISDPMRTVSANYSQGNEALLGRNAGKQRVAMLLPAKYYLSSNRTNISVNGLLPL